MGRNAGLFPEHRQAAAVAVAKTTMDDFVGSLLPPVEYMNQLELRKDAMKRVFEIGHTFGRSETGMCFEDAWKLFQDSAHLKQLTQ